MSTRTDVLPAGDNEKQSSAAEQLDSLIARNDKATRRIHSMNAKIMHQRDIHAKRLREFVDSVTEKFKKIYDDGVEDMDSALNSRQTQLSQEQAKSVERACNLRKLKDQTTCGFAVSSTELQETSKQLEAAETLIESLNTYEMVLSPSLDNFRNLLEQEKKLVYVRTSRLHPSELEFILLPKLRITPTASIVRVVVMPIQTEPRIRTEPRLPQLLTATIEKDTSYCVDGEQNTTASADPIETPTEKVDGIVATAINHLDGGVHVTFPLTTVDPNAVYIINVFIYGWTIANSPMKVRIHPIEGIIQELGSLPTLVRHSAPASVADSLDPNVTIKASSNGSTASSTVGATEPLQPIVVTDPTPTPTPRSPKFRGVGRGIRLGSNITKPGTGNGSGAAASSTAEYPRRDLLHVDIPPFQSVPESVVPDPVVHRNVPDSVQELRLPNKPPFVEDVMFDVEQMGINDTKQYDVLQAEAKLESAPASTEIWDNVTFDTKSAPAPTPIEIPDNTSEVSHDWFRSRTTTLESERPVGFFSPDSSRSSVSAYFGGNITGKLMMKFGVERAFREPREPVEKCFMFPIGCTKDEWTGDFVICDTGHHVVKIFDCNANLKRMSDCPFRRPAAVVALSNGLYAIRDDRNIQLLDRDGFLVRVMEDRSTSGRCYGLTKDVSGNIITFDVGDTGFTQENRGDFHTFGFGGGYRPGHVVSFDPGSGEVISRTEFNAHMGNPKTKCRFIHCFQDTLYVVDLGASVVFAKSLSGTDLFQFGGRGNNPGEFNEPSGITSDANGNLFVGDSKNDRVLVFTAKGDFLGKVRFNKKIKRPSAIHLTSDGHLMVMNYLLHYVSLFKLSPID